MSSSFSSWLKALFRPKPDIVYNKVALEEELNRLIIEMQQNHQNLRMEIAQIIATEKRFNARFEDKLETIATIKSNIATAIKKSQEANLNDDPTMVEEYEKVAKKFVERLVALEAEIEMLRPTKNTIHETATRANAFLESSKRALSKRIQQRLEILSLFDQSKMIELSVEARATVSKILNGEDPSLDGIRQEIEERHARALAFQELAQVSVGHHMDEVAQALATRDADDRLEEIRTELLLGTIDDKPQGLSTQDDQTIPKPLAF